MSSLNLPTGTVTFLFTDIENSTPLWERFPVEMEAALADHDRMMREAIESHGGLVVKTTGDGVHAVFEMAQDAVAAALAAQTAVITGSDLPDLAGAPIRIRAGLHTGDAQLRDGDYYGSAVNRAARLMGIGHGGQILLSGITAGLLDGRLPSEASLFDLGKHRLRGLSRPEQVFQLLGAGLPASFPPLRTDDGPPGNLPEELTRFIGREAELVAIKELLTHTRLLTITGPGGTGKTRLSLQVARSLVPDYRHGVWFVELASLADGDLVPQTVASLWAVSANPFATLSQQLADYLRAKELLLILDNCEHLVPACARLAADLLPVESATAPCNGSGSHSNL
jgi:class 3 adenylate cyclase